MITYHLDAAVIKRMDFVYIGISNSPSISGKVEYPAYPLRRQSPYKADQTQNMSISCRPNTPSGRFVVVQQPATQYGYLTICEIQVYGTKLGNTSIGWYHKCNIIKNAFILTLLANLNLIVNKTVQNYGDFNK